MNLKRAALQLGLQLVQCKLGQAVGDPSFAVFSPDQKEPVTAVTKQPTTAAQTRDRTAKVQPPRIVTTR